jgi:hypothetical protein
MTMTAGAVTEDGLAIPAAIRKLHGGVGVNSSPHTAELMPWARAHPHGPFPYGRR